MFNKKTTENDYHDLDETITALIESLSSMEKGGEEYTTVVTNLKTLMELRTADYKAWDEPWVSHEILITAGTHILGIVMLLGFEQRHVLTSKAMSFIPKIRM